MSEMSVLAQLLGPYIDALCVTPQPSLLTATFGTDREIGTLMKAAGILSAGNYPSVSSVSSVVSLSTFLECKPSAKKPR